MAWPVGVVRSLAAADNPDLDTAAIAQPLPASPDRYARMAEVRKTTDQAALAKLLTDPKEDRGVRFQAVAGLTDGKLLAEAIARLKAARDDPFLVVATLRLELLDPIVHGRLGDLEMIPTYVTNDPDPEEYTSETVTLEIRKKDRSGQALAFDKWTTEDQRNPCNPGLIPADIDCSALLAELLKNPAFQGSFPNLAREAAVPALRTAAVQAMDPQWADGAVFQAVADLARADPDDGVRLAAIEKVAQFSARDDGDPFQAQTVLIGIAQHDQDLGMRAAAVRHVTMQAVLQQIVRDDPPLRIAAVENLTDNQALLEKLALDETNEGVASVATDKLTNQAVLAKIALSRRDENVRRIALSKVTDQAVLARVVREELDTVPGLTALQHLQDQPMLAQLATGSSNPYVRSLAAANLTDQALLVKIARTETETEVLRAVVKHLADQPALAALAIECRDLEVRVGAVKNLTDQAMLAKVVRESIFPSGENEYEACSLALDKLTDQALLAGIALDTGPYREDVRETAVRALADPAVLTRIALLPGEDYNVPVAAAAKLTSLDDLAKVSQEGKTALVREYAATRRRLLVATIPVSVGSLDQAVMAALATESADPATRGFAMGRLADRETLKKIALEGKSPDMRRAAAFRLMDPFILAGVAAADADPKIRESAVQNIDEPAPLAQIAQTNSMPAIRACAVNKVKDQAVLAGIALGDPEPTVRAAALQQISGSDQAMIARLVAGETSGWARAAAVSHLTDQASLTKLAQEDPDEEVRTTAASQLAVGAQARTKIAQADPAPKVRAAAATGITDQAILGQLALADPAAWVRAKAVQQLTNQAILARVIQGDQDYGVRESAVREVTDHALLAKLAKEDPDAILRDRAVVRMMDLDGKGFDEGDEPVAASPAEIAQDAVVLAEIALAEKDDGVRGDAVSAVSDQNVLNQVARFDADARIRQGAAWRLTDKGVLALIAQQDHDPEVQKIATRRLIELTPK